MVYGGYRGDLGYRQVGLEQMSFANTRLSGRWSLTIIRIISVLPGGLNKRRALPCG